MFARIRVAFAALACLLATAPLAGPALADDAAPPRTLTLKVAAPSLAGNLLGDPVEQPVTVYLPPTYHQSDKRYPVVYFLPGFGESYYTAFVISKLLDTMIADGRSQEFIFVAVNGKNALGGSFFVDSPVTGGWENFVVSDVVGFVDHTYRTVPEAGRRAIAGFSMGAFAAVNLGLKHPEVFSIVYAQSPGLLATDGMREALAQWDKYFLAAYAAAFAPDVTLPRPYGRVLTASEIGSGDAVETAWNSGFGDLEAKINAYLARKTPLKAIHVDIGEFDGYRWINTGSTEFARLAKAAGIDVELVLHQMGHSFDMSLVEQSMVPFINTALTR
jgi:S-formylglutathione hydrolase FrmB